MTRAYSINQLNLSIFKGVALFLFVVCGILLFAVSPSLAQETRASNLIPAPQITNLSHNSIISNQQPEIRGRVLNFHTVEVFIDDKFVGHAETKIGSDGWANFNLKLDKQLGLGEHTIYTIAENNNHIRSFQSDIIKFRIEQAFPSPTLFQPEQGPRFRGVAWSNSRILVYVDEKLDSQRELGEHSSGVVGFEYEIIRHLKPGYHVVWIVAEHKLSHKVSQKSNQIIIYVPSGTNSANLKEKQTDFVPPVPSPTLVKPETNQVTDNRSPNISGLVKNEHVVKVFVDGEETHSFTPTSHTSGTANFSHKLDQELHFGLHEVYAKAINQQGLSSGKSNILRFLVTPELYHKKVVKTKPTYTEPKEVEEPEPEVVEKEPRIDEGISIVELPDEGEVKIIDGPTQPQEGQIDVVDEEEQGEVAVEDKIETEDKEQVAEVEDQELGVVDIVPPLIIDDQEETTPPAPEPKKEDWINIGFVVIGLILVVLIVWWVILERKEMKEEEDKQKQDEGHKVEVKAEDLSAKQEDKPPSQPDQLKIDGPPPEQSIDKTDSSTQEPPMSGGGMGV